MHTRNLKAVDEDYARLGINMVGCLHGHELERCNAEGCFGLRGDAFYGGRDRCMPCWTCTGKAWRQAVRGRRWP